MPTGDLTKHFGEPLVALLAGKFLHVQPGFRQNAYRRSSPPGFLDAITVLAGDESAYVRRSVGNHVRDWRRFAPEVADHWSATVDAPPDVRKLAAPRKRRSASKASSPGR